MAKTSAGMPTGRPPGVAAGETGDAHLGASEPLIADATAAGTAEGIPRGPSEAPPGAAMSAGSDGGIAGTWHSGVTVDALWSIDEVRNAWMRVVGVGWKKIYNGSEAAFTALSTLASQARQTGRSINYRDEPDGMVHEIYLW